MSQKNLEEPQDVVQKQVAPDNTEKLRLEEKELRRKENNEFLDELKKSGYKKRLDGFWQKDNVVYEIDVEDSHKIIEVKGMVAIPEDKPEATPAPAPTPKAAADKPVSRVAAMEKPVSPVAIVPRYDDDAPEELQRLDEEQIVAELSGRLVENSFYQVERYNPRTKQKEVQNILSLAGIKTIAQKMGCISVEPKDVIITETASDAYRVMVAVKDTKKNITMTGVSEQSRKQSYGDTTKPDPFALQKAYSKAVRNAIRWLLPEYVIQAAMDEWVRQKQKK